MTATTLDDARAVLGAFPGLAAIDHPYRGGSHDFRLEGTTAEPSLVLCLGGEDYELSESAAISAITSMPGASETVAERWPLTLLVPALNFFWDNRDGDFRALVDNSGQIRTFVKPTTIMFNPAEVLDAMADAMAEHGGKEHVVVNTLVHSLEETMLSVTVPGGMAERFIDARPGDTTVGGLFFKGSLLSTKKPELAIYTHRVVCDNGMVQNASSARFRAGSSDEDAEGPIEQMMEWMRTTCASLTGADMSAEFARIRHLTDHVVDADHLADTLGDIFSRFRVPAQAQSQVLEALTEEADGTMYGIVQAMTRAAQHSPSLTEQQRYQLMARAGEVSLHAQSICDSCQRPMSSSSVHVPHGAGAEAEAE